MMASNKGINSYSHILKYTGLFGGVQGLGILVGLVRNKLVAVLLGPGGMGLVSIYNSVAKLFSDSTNFGISMSAVRSLSELFDKGDEQALRRKVAVVRLWSLFSALFGTLVCILLSPLISRFTFSGNATLHFVVLSPVVGFTAITLGELAILKSVRRLGSLARISIFNAFAGLIISVPIYYFFGISGIVPSLVLMSLAQMLITLNKSLRLYPLKIEFSRAALAEGGGMVKLGLAFVLAGILGSGMEYLVRNYLNNVADIDTVGLYNAGFMLTMTYVGMVFSAMETDYFPRLSGVNHLGVTFRETVNRQIEIMVLLASPLLALFLVGVPVVLPLLFTGKFLPAIGMIRIVTLAMYFRAIKLPVQYIPLAKGDSRSYLLLEAIADVAILVCVVVFFNLYGLTGAGLGITIASGIDVLVTFTYSRWRYSYRPSTRVVRIAVSQVALGALTFAVTAIFRDGFAYWALGLLAAALSGFFSFNILRKDADLKEWVTRRFKK